MLYSFKYFTIRSGGHPQPLVGALVAVAVTAGSNKNIQVDDSSMFAIGNPVQIMEYDGTLLETCKVTLVPDGAHVTVASVANNHAGGVIGTGAWVVLAQHIQSTYVQTKDGNTGAIFLGTSVAMVTGTFARCVSKLMQVASGSQPTDFSDSRGGPCNIDNAASWWVDGTTGDSYAPSFGRAQGI
jgi:hypothetical protein